MGQWFNIVLCTTLKFSVRFLYRVYGFPVTVGCRAQ
uniref:Uncharacterized protein n=1 Tax=Anguilla anguilla TaxID=7936 RepID=A0A0E9VBN0_ANGAN